MYLTKVLLILLQVGIAVSCFSKSVQQHINERMEVICTKPRVMRGKNRWMARSVACVIYGVTVDSNRKKRSIIPEKTFRSFGEMVVIAKESLLPKIQQFEAAIASITTEKQDDTLIVNLSDIVEYNEKFISPTRVKRETSTGTPIDVNIIPSHNDDALGPFIYEVNDTSLNGMNTNMPVQLRLTRAIKWKPYKPKKSKPGTISTTTTKRPTSATNGTSPTTRKSARTTTTPTTTTKRATTTSTTATTTTTTTTRTSTTTPTTTTTTTTTTTPTTTTTTTPTTTTTTTPTTTTTTTPTTTTTTTPTTTTTTIPTTTTTTIPTTTRTTIPTTTTNDTQIQKHFKYVNDARVPNENLSSTAAFSNASKKDNFVPNHAPNVNTPKDNQGIPKKKPILNREINVGTPLNPPVFPSNSAWWLTVLGVPAIGGVTVITLLYKFTTVFAFISRTCCNRKPQRNTTMEMKG